jgi:hypothetical protein
MLLSLCFAIEGQAQNDIYAKDTSFIYSVHDSIENILLDYLTFNKIMNPEQAICLRLFHECENIYSISFMVKGSDYVDFLIKYNARKMKIGNYLIDVILDIDMVLGGFPVIKNGKKMYYKRYLTSHGFYVRFKLY